MKRKKIYKIICIIVLFIIFFLSFTFKYQKGDINHDNKYSTIDVILVQRYVLGLDNPCWIDKYCMDINSDFVIDEKDIEKIRCKIVGLE